MAPDPSPAGVEALAGPRRGRKTAVRIEGLIFPAADLDVKAVAPQGRPNKSGESPLYDASRESSDSATYADGTAADPEVRERKSKITM